MHVGECPGTTVLPPPGLTPDRGRGHTPGSDGAEPNGRSCGCGTRPGTMEVVNEAAIEYVPTQDPAVLFWAIAFPIYKVL